jgi:hypothetical protein
MRSLTRKSFFTGLIGAPIGAQSVSSMQRQWECFPAGRFRFRRRRKTEAEARGEGYVGADVDVDADGVMRRRRRASLGGSDESKPGLNGHAFVGRSLGAEPVARMERGVIREADIRCESTATHQLVSGSLLWWGLSQKQNFRSC